MNPDYARSSRVGHPNASVTRVAMGAVCKTVASARQVRFLRLAQGASDQVLTMAWRISSLHIPDSAEPGGVLPVLTRRDKVLRIPGICSHSSGDRAAPSEGAGRRFDSFWERCVNRPGASALRSLRVAMVRNGPSEQSRDADMGRVPGLARG